MRLGRWVRSFTFTCRLLGDDRCIHGYAVTLICSALNVGYCRSAQGKFLLARQVTGECLNATDEIVGIELNVLSLHSRAASPRLQRVPCG